MNPTLSHVVYNSGKLVLEKILAQVKPRGQKQTLTGLEGEGHSHSLEHSDDDAQSDEEGTELEWTHLLGI